MTNYAAEIYFKWAVVLRPFKSVEVMIAAFVHEHSAIAYARTLPEASKPFLRWLGHGVPPAEEHVTDGATYL